MLTVQGLLDYVQRLREAETTAGRAVFQVTAQALLEYEPSVAFGLLTETVAKTKEVDGEGKPVKGAKADPVVAVRMSELRQIYGAVRGGMTIDILSSGREAAVQEARAFLAEHEMTARGEAKAEVAVRAKRTKIEKAYRKAQEEVDPETLTPEQRSKVAAGMPIDLVLTQADRDALAAKALQSVQADQIKARLDRWADRAVGLIDEMLQSGAGEEVIEQVLILMRKRAESAFKGEAALV